MAIAKEWIEGEIEKLERELITAKDRKFVIGTQLSRVKADYAIAQQAVKTASGLIQALREELKFFDYDQEEIG
jgi:uncharacterized protein (DUF3084 family)